MTDRTILLKTIPNPVTKQFRAFVNSVDRKKYVPNDTFYESIHFFRAPSDHSGQNINLAYAGLNHLGTFAEENGGQISVYDFFKGGTVILRSGKQGNAAVISCPASSETSVEEIKTVLELITHENINHRVHLEEVVQAESEAA